MIWRRFFRTHGGWYLAGNLIYAQLLGRALGDAVMSAVLVTLLTVTIIATCEKHDWSLRSARIRLSRWAASFAVAVAPKDLKAPVVGRQA
jgi:hypothetical protein